MILRSRVVIDDEATVEASGGGPGGRAERRLRRASSLPGGLGARDDLCTSSRALLKWAADQLVGVGPLGGAALRRCRIDGTAPGVPAA